MAIIGAFTNGYILVNAVDLSDHCDRIVVKTNRAPLNATGMGAINSVWILGLGDATIEADFFADFAAAKTDQTLWPLQQGATTFAVEVRPVNAARSVTNPAYLMTCLLPEYTPIDGKTGDLLNTTVVFVNGAAAGLTRATS